MPKAASTLIVRVPDVAELPSESITFAVNVKLPGTAAAEIVPLMLPAALRLKPGGKLPELTTHVNGATPPVSVREVAGYGDPASPVVGSVPDVLIAGAALIVIVRFPVAVWVAESVAMTVKLNAPAAVGAPEIMPAVLKANPLGNVPDVTAHV
jgi:hypothetical protein